MFCSNPFRNLAILLVALCATDVCAQGLHGSSYRPQQIDRYVGQHVPDIWDESQPIERFLTAVAKRSYLKLEYLHWDLDGPRNQNLGAPILDVADPLTPFQVFDNLNGGASAGLAIVPGTNNLGMEDTSGVRGTLGVDLNGGMLELGFFGTEETGDDFMLTNLQAGRVIGTTELGTELRPNVVTPLLTNGGQQTQAAMNAFVYDNSFQGTIDSQLWGGEVLLLKELYLPHEAFNWQWLGGFRYVSFDESFTQIGTYNNGGGLPVNRVTQIGGNTINNVYGPEVGGRASVRTKFVTLSATPRIAFALNDHTSSVITGPLTAASAPVVRVISESIDFAPIVELNLQMQIHITPNFSIIGGYDFFYMFQISRPNENVVYNSVPGPGGAFTPNIGQKVSLTEMMAQGFNVGGLWTY